MSAIIILQFTVPVGHEKGDYAHLHGNGGEGEINWNLPLTNEVFDLFPKGSGIYGWGRAPWGYYPWGHTKSIRCNGWGSLPWGHYPWGHGTVVITAQVSIADCGIYKFGFACYDKFDNLHEGTPDEKILYIHIPPPTPTGLSKYSYNKDTDVLILSAA